MKKILFVALMFLTSSGLQACAQTAVSGTDKTAKTNSEAGKTDAIYKEIVEINGQMVSAFKRGDYSGVAGFFSDDATIYRSPERHIKGREAIAQYWEEFKNAKDWKMEVIEVGGSQNEIYQIGKCTMIFEHNGKLHNAVSDVVFIWKRQKNGQLKIYAEIYN